MKSSEVMGLQPGTRVTFTGGLGRGDDPDAVHEGMVNGEPVYGPPAYVPLYVREHDHTVMVAAPNVVRMVA